MASPIKKFQPFRPRGKKVKKQCKFSRLWEHTIEKCCKQALASRWFKPIATVQPNSSRPDISAIALMASFSILDLEALNNRFLSHSESATSSVLSAVLQVSLLGTQIVVALIICLPTLPYLLPKNHYLILHIFIQLMIHHFRYQSCLYHNYS